MKYNLGFIFTNYNNSTDTINSIHSINNIRIETRPIIVIVDNNSTLSEVEKLLQLEKDFPDIVILFNKQNYGYFNGLNFGIKYLKKQLITVDFLVIGNNDLIFPNDFFESINLKAGIICDFPVISPNIVTEDGFHQNPHVINKISWFREVIYDLYFSSFVLAKIISKVSSFTKKYTARKDESQFLNSQVIYQGHGSCYILTPIFWEYFEELFAPSFLMGEEYFLSFQLNQFGLNIFYESSIEVVHKWHASLSLEPKKKIWGISKESHKIYRRHLKYYNKLKS